MSQTLGTSPFPPSALALKPEEFPVNVSEAHWMDNSQLMTCIQQSLGTISEYGSIWHD